MILHNQVLLILRDLSEDLKRYYQSHKIFAMSFTQFLTLAVESNAEIDNAIEKIS